MFCSSSMCSYSSIFVLSQHGSFFRSLVDVWDSQGPAARPQTTLVLLPRCRSCRRRRGDPQNSRGSCLGVRGVRVSKIGKFCKFLQIFWRARSRLYQNEFLQESMRSTEFFKLYNICILLHRCNLKILAKNRFEKTAIFVKFQQKKCKCREICKILQNFKKFS